MCCNTPFLKRLGDPYYHRDASPQALYPEPECANRKKGPYAREALTTVHDEHLVPCPECRPIDDKGTLKIASYFIRKADADRLRAGEKVPPTDITLYGYGDLGNDPSGRLRSGDPNALVACDLVIGESW